MSDFDRALEIVLKWEGGFVNTPADPGGATNLGITRETLRRWRGAPVSVEDVRTLTRPEAREIYRSMYWRTCRCGEMDWAAALMVFDSAVNHGPRQAALFLQRVVGVEADGLIGPVTLQAVRKACPETVAEEMGARRMTFYGELATFGVFGLGWSRRLMNILRLCITPAAGGAPPGPGAPRDDSEAGSTEDPAGAAAWTRTPPKPPARKRIGCDGAG